ncbi:hypothetical protein HOLleu_05659 [Holothuria leucospilota]|uniref:Uncharacterized protein n=1 Tax=Holothuria leucospilota TaxID=206669 RepID=A0A9Q1HJ35_HOLLE|nr:hypothetical protein HOLleu_05659 [Holothuria leucospilota]
MSAEEIAKVIAESNRGIAESLAKSLQGMRLHAQPSVRLSRCTGFPRKPGDQTLTEWLDDFEAYCRQFEDY